MYCDIGKKTNDLFNRNLFFNGLKFEAKTIAPNGVVRELTKTFHVTGMRDTSGTFSGDIKSKYTNKAKGFSVQESWTTNNALLAEVELLDYKGLGLKLAGSVAPGEKTTKVFVNFKKCLLHTKGQVDLMTNQVGLDFALSHKGFMFGGDGAYKNGAFSKCNFL